MLKLPVINKAVGKGVSTKAKQETRCPVYFYWKAMSQKGNFTGRGEGGNLRIATGSVRKGTVAGC